MKKTVLLFALFFTTISFSQFVMDYTYFYTQGVQRIVLENSGEKYYSVNWQTGRIQFFNANHTPWKSVMLPLPSQNWTVGITNISETKINADDNLEIVYSTYSSPNIRQCKIVNELGTVLLSVDNCESLKLDEKDGLPNKIISSTGVVYTVPELITEHTYSGGITTRVNLENSGEKYYVLDRTNSLVNLYNADHSFWKSIPLNKPEDATLGWTIHLSENLVNSDNLTEVGYYYYRFGVNPLHEAKIINENGVSLLIVPNGEGFMASSIEGLPNKLMANIYEEGVKIYSVPDFILEHTYDEPMIRVKLENAGEKYYASSYRSGTTAITIYNSDHTLWKTITTPVESEWGASIGGVSVSQTIIDPDDYVEIIYTISSNTLDGGHYYSYIVKDDGTVLLDLPGAYGVYLSEFPNLEKKLMVYTQDGPSFDQLYYTTIVFGFEEAFAVNGFNKSKISIAPNPAQNIINLMSKTTIVEVNIFDIRGIRISQSEGKDIKSIDVEHLSSGLYLLQLNDVYGVKSTHKIVVSH